MKSEIAKQRPEITRDAYGHLRNSLPGGAPGRLVSTLHRAEDDQRGDVDSLEQQALNNMEFGTLGGK